MPTNRQILKEKVATYASVLLDGAYEAGGQDAVLEVRDQAERILRIARSNMDLSDAWRTAPIRPSRGVSWCATCSHPAIPSSSTFWPSWPSARTSRCCRAYGPAMENSSNAS